MKAFTTFVGTLALVASACAPPRPTPAPTPEPAPVIAPPVASPEPAPPPRPAPPPAPALAEAPRNWQLLDPATDSVPGIGAARAMRELLAGRRPQRTVVVAVIDGGVDTAHVDLRANLWTNPKEVRANGRDDDRNGYADDVRGWNFIGGRDGRDVHHDTYEVTRLHARCTTGAASGSATGAARAPAPSREQCAAVAADFAKARGEAEQQGEQVRQINAVLARALPLLREAAGGDSLTTARVTALQSTRPEVQQARQIYLRLAENGITPEEVRKAAEDVESRLKYGLNVNFDPRPIVGDSAGNVAERRYGNADVMGPDAGHGTHVAGIIAAVGGNGVGIDGVAPAARVMAVRAVPDGDERDKDVANAIRYAVDNGAQIINMSFGKGYSPNKAAVDAAVKYADARGVLMVHAAGNEGADLATSSNFPTPGYLGGGQPRNWIEVGASSWKRDALAASFSNFGRAQVDVFAPGVDILSTVPGGGYERESGTSMAAPVVSGLAALLMGYYPTLTAADVKRIILASATRYTDLRVPRPGSETGEQVAFGSLSATGAVVNAHAAIRMAEEVAAVRP